LFIEFKEKNMKKFVIIAVLIHLLGCNTKPKEMGKEFEKFDGYYFFSAQLKKMEMLNIPNTDSIWYGRLDVKTSRLELINVDSWMVVKVLELSPYKGNVFLIKGFDSFFLNLDPDLKNDKGQHDIDFIEDKEDVKKYITGGHFVYTLKSIEDCKKHLEQWNKELEELNTNCPSGDCYGTP
jgi:hypothetical protein